MKESYIKPNVVFEEEDIILYYSACELKREQFAKWMGMEISDEELEMANIEYEKVFKRFDIKYSPWWRDPAAIIKATESRCSISRVLRALEFCGFEVKRYEGTR